MRTVDGRNPSRNWAPPPRPLERRCRHEVEISEVTGEPPLILGTDTTFRCPGFFERCCHRPDRAISQSQNEMTTQQASSSSEGPVLTSTIVMSPSEQLGKQTSAVTQIPLTASRLTGEALNEMAFQECANNDAQSESGSQMTNVTMLDSDSLSNSLDAMDLQESDDSRGSSLPGTPPTGPAIPWTAQRPVPPSFCRLTKAEEKIAQTEEPKNGIEYWRRLAHQQRKLERRLTTICAHCASPLGIKRCDVLDRTGIPYCSQHCMYASKCDAMIAARQDPDIHINILSSDRCLNCGMECRFWANSSGEEKKFPARKNNRNFYCSLVCREVYAQDFIDRDKGEIIPSTIFPGFEYRRARRSTRQAQFLHEARGVRRPPTQHGTRSGRNFTEPSRSIPWTNLDHIKVRLMEHDAGDPEFSTAREDFVKGQILTGHRYVVENWPKDVPRNGTYRPWIECRRNLRTKEGDICLCFPLACQTHMQLYTLRMENVHPHRRQSIWKPDGPPQRPDPAWLDVPTALRNFNRMTGVNLCWTCYRPGAIGNADYGVGVWCCCKHRTTYHMDHLDIPHGPGGAYILPEFNELGSRNPDLYCPKCEESTRIHSTSESVEHLQQRYCTRCDMMFTLESSLRDPILRQRLPPQDDIEPIGNYYEGSESSAESRDVSSLDHGDDGLDSEGHPFEDTEEEFVFQGSMAANHRGDTPPMSRVVSVTASRNISEESEQN